MRTLDELENRLSRPSPGLVADLTDLKGDLVVLGAGGKLGPSLVRLAVRAIAEAGTGAQVIAVSRFGSAAARRLMESTGARVVASDLFDDAALDRLPDAPHVVYLVGAKFGTHGQEGATWATNAYLPGRIARRYAGSRIAALSTGNVYPLVPVESGGATEDLELSPVGEYAMSCLGRERVLSHFAALNDTPMTLIRLNYAVEMRYGVLVDLAQQILAGLPIDLTTGFANVVWQGYANEVTLRSLRYADVPPFVLNVTGPETVGSGRSPSCWPIIWAGRPVSPGLRRPLRCCPTRPGATECSDTPEPGLDTLARMTAEWVSAGGPTLGKPTKFQQRDGKF